MLSKSSALVALRVGSMLRASVILNRFSFFPTATFLSRSKSGIAGVGVNPAGVGAGPVGVGAGPAGVGVDPAEDASGAEAAIVLILLTKSP